jgi:glycosyltransferase involved in cell wall biosynthesis
VGFGFAVHAPLVTLAGRFQDVKGHHVFLDMARRILDTRSDVQFAVAGDNAFGVAADAAYQQRVLSIAASDPALAKSVRFLGFVSRCDELLAASDVVVCSSRFESFGMVHIEAMASGVPVVSTNVGGPAETIVDGTTGWLVPPDRPDLLADRVRGLLDDPDERRRMGAAGRARVLAHFTLDRYAASMADLFASARRPAITSS